MTSLQVFLPDDAVARIAVLAAEAGRSPDAFLTDAILEYIEDIEDVAQAEARLNDLHAGKVNRARRGEQQIRSEWRERLPAVTQDVSMWVGRVPALAMIAVARKQQGYCAGIYP